MGLAASDFRYLTASEQQDIVRSPSFHYEARAASAANNIISPQKQVRHVSGTSENEQYRAQMAVAGRSHPSELTITQEQAQALVRRHAGAGQASYNGSSCLNQETCRADGAVGVYYDMGNVPHVTSWLKIMYAKNSAHIGNSESLAMLKQYLPKSMR